jgi:hypothetical protein
VVGMDAEGRRFGSPVVGVRGRPEGGVDEGWVAEPGPQHGLRLARHGSRRRHGSWSWGTGAEGGNRVRAGKMTRRHTLAPVAARSP